MSSVKLISFTPDSEKTILYIARVSSKDQNSTNVGLINFLIRNGHWSPFEHAMMTLEIITSRAISQQITRHRSFTFQEFSQRYATAVDWIMYPVRIKGDTNRQGSLETDDKELQKWWNDIQRNCNTLAFNYYEEALNKGVAPEVARFILPMSTITKLYMTGTLRSWIHYLGEGPGGRTNLHTQKEHCDLALEGKAIFSTQFPIIAKALGWVDAEIE
jgi:thymidylate synthase (FAD)